MRFFYTICLISSITLSGFSQEEALTFPANWEGNWTGRLEIFSPKGKEQEIPMELHILPLDSNQYSWNIIYGEDKEDGLRAYILKTEDPDRGWYTIDEQNGIILDAILISGKLYSRFDVMGSMLLSTVEMIDNELHYEIISGNMDPLRTTGDTVFEEEAIPEVSSYPIVVRQFAVLRRE
ncbi:MAG: hypothetical protein MI974_13045 [Chitinophagales bacterium]|nr:hypothetical protein [Chitinophagales bacterium]